MTIHMVEVKINGMREKSPWFGQMLSMERLPQFPASLVPGPLELPYLLHPETPFAPSPEPPSPLAPQVHYYCHQDSEAPTSPRSTWSSMPLMSTIMPDSSAGDIMTSKNLVEDILPQSQGRNHAEKPTQGQNHRKQ